MYILAAIATSVMYAVSDTISGILSRKNHPLQLSIWSSCITIAALLPVLLLFFMADLQKLTLGVGLLLVVLSAFQAIGGVCFLFGMKQGSPMLTGIIAGSFPVVTIIVGMVLFQELPTVIQFAAIILILVGIVFASAHGSIRQLVRAAHSSGVGYAFGAMVLWGIYFALIKIPVHEVGLFVPQYASSVIGLIIYVMLARQLRVKNTKKVPKGIGLVVVSTFAMVVASLAYNYAITSGPVSLVAPIAGSSPVIFVVLAYVVFREKLTLRQWLGVLLTVTGIVLISLQ